MSWIWLGLTLVFVVVEISTAELVSIWFVCGAVASLLSALLGAPVWLQIVQFIAASLGVLVFVRPIIMKKLKTQKVPTNADMLIGRTAIVVEDIDLDNGTGHVTVSGDRWLARSEKGELIGEGEKVTVLAITGATLIVKPREDVEK